MTILQRAQTEKMKLKKKRFLNQLFNEIELKYVWLLFSAAIRGDAEKVVKEQTDSWKRDRVLFTL